MIKRKQLPVDIEQRIALLIPILAQDERVVFAYLFGGLTSGTAKPLSDVDLAVYLEPQVSRIEAKLDLLGMIADALGTDEVDLVILNDAPVSLTGRILKTRRILLDKQPFLRHDYESLTLRKFFDFSHKEQEILIRRFA